MTQKILWKVFTLITLLILITFKPYLDQDRRNHSIGFTGETKMVIPNQLFKPILSFPSPEIEKQMGSTTLEGLRLPSIEVMTQQSLPIKLTKRMFDNAVLWIERVLQPKWLVENLSSHLYAIRKAVNQKDAFIGAWSSHGRIFQVVITQEDLHLITQISPLWLTGNNEENMKKILGIAREFLQLPKHLNSDNWWMRSLNGSLIGAPRIDTYDKNWDETLVFLIQGTGLKLTIGKQMNAGDPPELTSPPPKVPPPWFPPESK